MVNVQTGIAHRVLNAYHIEREAEIVAKTGEAGKVTVSTSMVGGRRYGRFRHAQRKVEIKNFRNRKTMLYYEKERKKIQRSMGQAPYLDTPS